MASTSGLLEWGSPSGSLRVVVEDDGRVGYAYLLKGGSICADVWLWNSIETPLEPQWLRPPGGGPYLNSANFAAPHSLGAVLPDRRLEVQWSMHVEKDIPVAQLLVDGVLHARLWEGAKPGECRLAQKAGPLAHPLTDRLSTAQG